MKWRTMLGQQPGPAHPWEGPSPLVLPNIPMGVPADEQAPVHGQPSAASARVASRAARGLGCLVGT